MSTDKRNKIIEAGMKSCLFIGGIADGQWCMVPSNAEQWRYSKEGKEINEVSREIIVNTYKRMQVTDGSERWSVFVFEQLSNDEAMRMFIENYHPLSNDLMTDADWHQIQQYTKTDIHSMVMKFIRNYSITSGNLAAKDLLHEIAEHCEAAFNVGRGVKL